MKNLFRAVGLKLGFIKPEAPAPKNFKQIVATFDSVVTELSELEKRNDDEAKKKAAQAARLAEEQKALTAEADKARNVRAKVAALISA